MKLPTIEGTIARRILANFRAAPEVVGALIPRPFRPKLHDGHAIVGVCLIRLENIRPAFLPIQCGIGSENAAHRIAVEWDEDGQSREAVFIPRRDTNSYLNHLSGGRVFPGEHSLADFRVCESENALNVQVRSRDSAVEVRVAGTVGHEFPASSCFDSLEQASAFFEGGCLGFSARCNSEQLDGLRLQTENWKVDLLDTCDVYSSYFADETRFPSGSVIFDHALLMRGIKHQWHAAPPPLCAQDLA